MAEEPNPTNGTGVCAKHGKVITKYVGSGDNIKPFCLECLTDMIVDML